MADENLDVVLDLDEYVGAITKAHGSDADASAQAVDTLIKHNKAMIDKIASQESQYATLNDKYTKMALRIATGDNQSSLNTAEEREMVEKKERESKIKEMLQ